MYGTWHVPLPILPQEQLDPSKKARRGQLYGLGFRVFDALVCPHVFRKYL